MLEVRGVQTEDLGPVTCVARVCSPGVPPSTVSCSTQLTLDSAAGCPATLLRGPSDTTAMRGDRVLLKAIYRGNPEPSVRWLKAVSILTISEHLFFSFQSQFKPIVVISFF